MAIGHANLDETKDTSTGAVLASGPKYHIRTISLRNTLTGFPD